MGRAASGEALIFIDDFHAARRPAQLDGPFLQMVLTLGAFPVFDHLPRSIPED